MSKAKKGPRPAARTTAPVLDRRAGTRWSWTWWMVIGGIVVVGAAIIVVAVSSSKKPIPVKEAPQGTEALGEQSRGHVNGTVSYGRRPPGGGDHNPAWQNCGVYDSPVQDENVVHSLEHGAVWITYDPAIGPTDVQALRSLVTQNYVGEQRYIVLSPYPGQDAPVIATSWGNQLKVQSATDPRLLDYIEVFAGNPEYAPEPGGACSGAVGSPVA